MIYGDAVIGGYCGGPMYSIKLKYNLQYWYIIV